jgi:hypothetical protein
MSGEGEDAGRELGRRLRLLRRAAGLTQHELAARTGYARGTLSSAESGRLDQSAQFWERCDLALDTDGELSAASQRIKRLAAGDRQSQADRERGTRLADLARKMMDRTPTVSPDTDIHVRLTNGDGVIHYLCIPVSAANSEHLAETLRMIFP